MSSDILDYFPMEKIRPTQKDALLQVHAAFESGKKFVILEAPPGVGKSAIAVALSRYYRSSYVLTLTKMLQSQYVSLFADARELKGRSNFECLRVKDVGGGSCEIGGDRKLCQPPGCSYRVAKAEAVLSDLTICNYMSYLYAVGATSFSSASLSPPKTDEDGNFIDDRKMWTRPLLVLDEAHGAEEVMLDHVSVTIDPEKIPIKLDFPLPQDGNVNGCFAWLELFSQTASERLGGSTEVDQDEDLLTVHIGPPALLTSKEVKVLERAKWKADFALQHRDAEKWIAEPLSDGRKGFCLKPLTVRSFASRLFKYGERVLLMSATILDSAKMAHDLGLELGSFAYVSVPCPFPVENRPVICARLNMKKSNRSRNWPAMVDQISIILDAHEAEKGLILCPSNEMVDYIIAGLPKPKAARMISARGSNRLIDYQRHLDAKGPSVLIAAGFWEGADLKDDYSRFQILPAIPRPYWGGQIAARATIDPTWYRLQAFMQLVQGIGRSVRSDTDSATSYILDGALKDEDSRGDSMLPKWFREALIYA